MYCGHACLGVCLWVCLSVLGRMPTLLHGPGCNLGSGRGCPLVVHYWSDLQSVHGLHCYGNITGRWNVSEYMLVLALCLVYYILDHAGLDNNYNNNNNNLPVFVYCAVVMVDHCNSSPWFGLPLCFLRCFDTVGFVTGRSWKDIQSRDNHVPYSKRFLES